MKRLALLAALMLVALTIASAAMAAIYAGPTQWSPGASASTAFSPNWLRNAFGTHGSGYDKTVTFIDNRTYSWHNTVRNTSSWTETYSPYPGTDKGHCRAHSYFSGSCFIY